MKKINGGRLFILNSYWFGLAFMWSSLYLIILPTTLLQYMTDAQKNIWLMVLFFLGLLLSMIVQPLTGAMSDRWRSTKGRRHPFIWLGTLGNLLFLVLIGFGKLPGLFIGCIGLQITANITQGALQGLLPDEIHTSQLGPASSIKTIMEISGVLLGSLTINYLISSVNPGLELSIMVLIGCLLLFGGITLLFSHEKPVVYADRTRTDWKSLWNEVFYSKNEADKQYQLLILSRFFYLTGFLGFQSLFQPFLQGYIADRFASQEPAQITQWMTVFFTIMLLLFVIIGGKLSCRFGFKKLQIGASLLGSAGTLLLVFCDSQFLLFFSGFLLASGLGIFLSMNWALANERAPQGDVGKYIGLTNIATAGSIIVSRFGQPLKNILNNASPDQWHGWTVLFGISAVLMLISALLLKKIPEDKVQE